MSFAGVSGMMRNKDNKLVCSVCGYDKIRIGFLVEKRDKSWTVYGKCPKCEAPIVLKLNKKQNANNTSKSDFDAFDKDFQMLEAEEESMMLGN